MIDAFAANEPMVISEIIDDEAVVIDLEKGTYYSLKDAAALVWAGIQASATVDRIAAALRTSFDVGDREVEGDLRTFLAALAKEALIRPVEPGSAEFSAAWEGTRAYQAPTLEKFTDMEAMLLLDPVHDVDEAGWPHRS